MIKHAKNPRTLKILNISKRANSSLVTISEISSIDEPSPLIIFQALVLAVKPVWTDLANPRIAVIVKNQDVNLTLLLAVSL
jgi:hypothetical protein